MSNDQTERHPPAGSNVIITDNCVSFKWNLKDPYIVKHFFSCKSENATIMMVCLHDMIKNEVAWYHLKVPPATLYTISTHLSLYIAHFAGHKIFQPVSKSYIHRHLMTCNAYLSPFPNLNHYSFGYKLTKNIRLWVYFPCKVH